MFFSILHLLLCSIDWSAVVVDEAHKIKNPNAQITQAMKDLKCEVRCLCIPLPTSACFQIWRHTLNLSIHCVSTLILIRSELASLAPSCKTTWRSCGVSWTGVFNNLESQYLGVTSLVVKIMVSCVRVFLFLFF